MRRGSNSEKQSGLAQGPAGLGIVRTQILIHSSLRDTKESVVRKWDQEEWECIRHRLATEASKQAIAQLGGCLSDLANNIQCCISAIRALLFFLFQIVVMPPRQWLVPPWLVKFVASLLFSDSTSREVKGRSSEDGEGGEGARGTKH